MRSPRSSSACLALAVCLLCCAAQAYGKTPAPATALPTGVFDTLGTQIAAWGTVLNETYMATHPACASKGSPVMREAAKQFNVTLTKVSVYCPLPKIPKSPANMPPITFRPPPSGRPAATAAAQMAAALASVEMQLVDFVQQLSVQYLKANPKCKTLGIPLMTKAIKVFGNSAQTVFKKYCPLPDIPIGKTPSFNMPPFNMPPFNVPPFNVPPFKVPPFNVPPFNVPPFNMPPFKIPTFRKRN